MSIDLEMPLCSSTAKRMPPLPNPTRLHCQYNSNSNDVVAPVVVAVDHDDDDDDDDDEQRLFPPPPASFLYDNPISSTDTHPIIRATGPGLTDGFVDENCKQRRLPSELIIDRCLSSEVIST
jgi:hypothetical protein